MKYNFSNIPLAAFQTLVRGIAAERPDFVYLARGAGCYYHLAPDVRGIESRCLIGEALSRLGVDEADLKDPCKVFDVAFTAAHTLLPALGFRQDVVDWATRVQMSQDNGNPWGEAAGLA